MPSTAIYPHLVSSRLSEETGAALAALAARRGLSQSEMVREILERAVGDAAANDALGPVRGVVRKEVRAEVKPIKEKVAAQGKLLYKTAVDAAYGRRLAHAIFWQLAREDGLSEADLTKLLNQLYKEAVDSLHVEDLSALEDEDAR